jgi:hypothetical protein
VPAWHPTTFDAAKNVLNCTRSLFFFVTSVALTFFAYFVLPFLSFLDAVAQSKEP